MKEIYRGDIRRLDHGKTPLVKESATLMKINQYHYLDVDCIFNGKKKVYNVLPKEGNCFVDVYSLITVKEKSYQKIK